MDLVEGVQEPSCSDCHGMGGCYCIRTGGGILCQPLFLPELCDSFFLAGKIIADGDYLFVSKMSYGPRVPQTPPHMPLAQHTLPFFNCKSYLEHPQWDYKRVKGLGMYA